MNPSHLPFVVGVGKSIEFKEINQMKHLKSLREFIRELASIGEIQEINREVD
jgi:hypothetical protein